MLKEYPMRFLEMPAIFEKLMIMVLFLVSASAGLLLAEDENVSEFSNVLLILGNPNERGHWSFTQPYPTRLYSISDGQLKFEHSITTKYQGSSQILLSEDARVAVVLSEDVQRLDVAVLDFASETIKFRRSSVHTGIDCTNLAFVAIPNIDPILVVRSQCIEHSTPRLQFLNLKTLELERHSDELYGQIVLPGMTFAQPAGSVLSNQLALQPKGNLLATQVDFGSIVPVVEMPSEMSTPHRSNTIKKLSTSNKHGLAIIEAAKQTDSRAKFPAILWLRENSTGKWKKNDLNDGRVALKLLGNWLVLEIPAENSGSATEAKMAYADSDRLKSQLVGSIQERFLLGTRHETPFDGNFRLLHLEDGRELELMLDEMDTEILSISKNSILIRKGDQLLVGEIAPNEILCCEEFANDPIIPGIHWAIIIPEHVP